MTEEDGKEAAAYFADKGVEAIFTNGDHVAAGIQSQAPGEWLVIGRDNLYISELLQLSTIDHHLQACGETAVQLAVMEKAATIACPMSSSNDSYRRNDAQTVPLSGQCLRIVFLMGFGVMVNDLFQQLRAADACFLIVIGGKTLVLNVHFP